MYIKLFPNEITITSEDVYCSIRNVKSITEMNFMPMFITAVCILFLLKLKWPKTKNFYDIALDNL